MLFGLFGMVLQRKLNSKKCSDGCASNIKVTIVDPGLIRSRANMRYWFGGKKLHKFKRLRYHLITKSCWLGAQSIMYALFSKDIKCKDEANYVKNCLINRVLPRKYRDHKYQDIIESKAMKQELTFYALPWRPKRLYYYCIPILEDQAGDKDRDG